MMDRFLHIKYFSGYNFLFWMVLCILELLRTIAFTHHFNFEYPVSNLIRWPLSVYLSYWILSCLIFNAYLGTHQFKRFYFVLVHLAMSLGFGILHKVLSGVSVILGQSLKAARANPVDSLRVE